MTTERPGRRIPLFVKVAVPAVALGVALLLVGLAWRASRADRPGSADRAQPAVPVEGTDPFLGCPDCHGDLDKVFERGGLPLLRYTHEDHFATGVSDCSVCHPADTHEPDRINRPTMGRCFTCHGTTRVAIAPGECSTCHPPGIPDRPPTHLAARWLPRGHAEEASVSGFECVTCHRPSTCRSCHGLEMPHPEGWDAAPHVAAFFQGPAVCERCHARAPDRVDDCDRCHHPQGPEGVPWRRAHPRVVQEEGAFTCFDCHSEVTCSACHVRGREDFSADRAVAAAAGPAPPSPTGG